MRRLTREYFGATYTHQPRLKPRANDSRRSVVGTGDWHGDPSAEILAAIVNEQPNLIIVGGDLLDSREASPHMGLPGEKANQESIQEEMWRVRGALEFLIENTEADSWVIRGNHDDWSARTVTQLLPAWALEFWTDPLDMILAELPPERINMNRENWTYSHADGMTVEEFGYSEYLCVCGDAILSHANFSGKWPGDAARQLNLWLTRWRRVLSLPDYTLLVQFHGHKVSYNEEEGGHLVLVEPGISGNLAVEGYKVGYKSMWSPGALGAVYFEQTVKNEDWFTDGGSVRLIRPALFENGCSGVVQDSKSNPCFHLLECQLHTHPQYV